MSQGSVADLAGTRRSAVRYRLRLPVIFQWTDETEHTGGGFTCDVALDGALILSSRCPPVGADIRIEILIPAPDNSTEEIRIECMGKVTRVIQQSGCFGVSGRFDDDHLTRQLLPRRRSWGQGSVRSWS